MASDTVTVSIDGPDMWVPSPNILQLAFLLTVPRNAAYSLALCSSFDMRVQWKDDPTPSLSLYMYIHFVCIHGGGSS